MKSVPAAIVLLLAAASPLAAQTVYDGDTPLFDEDFETTLTQVDVSWNGFTAFSDGFDWRVGTTPGAGDVFVQNGLPNTATGATAVVTLTPGTRYYITVDARDMGFVAESATSDGFLALAPLAPLPASGSAPLTVYFVVPNYPGVVLYEWDFLEDSDTEPSFEQTTFSPHGGAFSFTYATPNHQYFPILRLTDDQGNTVDQWLFDESPAGIQVGAPAAGAPSGGLSASTVLGAAPLPVTFTADVSTFDGTVVAYLWDFDGDGAIDFSSETSNQATFTYTQSRSFDPAVIVVDAQGATARLELPADGFVQVDPPATPVPSLSGPTLLTSGPHQVGDVLTFEAIVGTNGGSDPVRIEWDFDGDRVPDLIQPITGPGFPQTLLAQWRIQRPDPSGILATAWLYNADNLSADNDVGYSADLNPALQRAWVIQPEPQQKVWGDFVTLLASTVAPGVDLQIEFQYRDAQTSGPFLPVPPAEQAGGPASPVVFPAGTNPIGYHWDVTTLNPAAFPGGVELQAVVTPLNPGTMVPAGPAFTSPSAIFRLDSNTSDPDVLVENHGSPFTQLKLQGVTLTGLTTVSILQDTSWQFAPGSVATYEQMRLERRGENPYPAESTLQGLRFVPNRFRRDGFQSGQPLLKPAKVSVYLAPADADVLADGTDLRTSRFMLFKFNPARQRWEPLVVQTYDATQKVATALVTSGGDLALAVLDHGASGGSSSGCGLLGAEALPLAAFLLLRLRRRP